MFPSMYQLIIFKDLLGKSSYFPRFKFYYQPSNIIIIIISIAFTHKWILMIAWSVIPIVDMVILLQPSHFHTPFRVIQVIIWLPGTPENYILYEITCSFVHPFPRLLVSVHVAATHSQPHSS